MLESALYQPVLCPENFQLHTSIRLASFNRLRTLASVDQRWSNGFVAIRI
jgi:hypothetical protein